VEELLHILQADSAALDRQAAAEKLGNVETSHPRIVQALIAACDSPSLLVSAVAAESLRAPVHREYVQQHPDLLEAAERALEPVPGLDNLGAIRSRHRKAAMQYDRKKPTNSNLVVVSISGGIILLGIGIAGLSGIISWFNPAYLNLVLILAGVVLVACALWTWLAPWSARNVFLRSMKETVGTVEDLDKKEYRGEYGKEYRYFVTVLLEADDANMGTRMITLKVQVAHSSWKGMKRGDTVGIRYAAEDPRLALIEGEWETGW
jgi:hypothetical protein